MTMKVYTLEEVDEKVFGPKGTPKRDALEKRLVEIEEKNKEKYSCPGDYIRENIKVEGMKQKECAEKLGISPSNLSEILKGKRTITPTIAERLEVVFDYPKEIWLKLQDDYDTQKKLQKRNNELSDDNIMKLIQAINNLNDTLKTLVALQKKDSKQIIKI